MSLFSQQYKKIQNSNGFIAALDQSGGSTPKALKAYGIEEDQYANEEEMFTRVHDMRTRIITNSRFVGEKILGAILFENTLDRDILGQSSAHYLWKEKNIVPFLKVDKGLDQEINGVQLMKPMPELDMLLSKAKKAGVFGTKMRSVIMRVNTNGIADIVQQQFHIGKQILSHELVPIIEPEVNIHAPDKREAEGILQKEILRHLDTLKEGQEVMLKLTLPEEENLYTPCVQHPRVLRVVALSGGYSREEANQRLEKNTGIIASFSRALSQDLRASQSDAEFTEALGKAIDSIYTASLT